MTEVDRELPICNRLQLQLHKNRPPPAPPPAGDIKDNPPVSGMGELCGQDPIIKLHTECPNSSHVFIKRGGLKYGHLRFVLRDLNVPACFCVLSVEG